MSTKSFPKISIITPSFNQAQFLEETINSVLSQNYPNLEYIVVDGKSTDGSHGIIQKYQNQLTWIRDPDKNQTEAINKGFRRATGNILAYLNSDDMYLPDTLNRVSETMNKNQNLLWLTGDCVIVNEHGREINRTIRYYKNMLSLTNNLGILKIANYISQPSTFLKRDLFKLVGPFNEALNYTMDLDYWIRCYKYSRPKILMGLPLSRFRIHTKSKGGSAFALQFLEYEKVLEMNDTQPIITKLNKLHNKITGSLYRNHYRR